jgi:hypothetical protein
VLAGTGFALAALAGACLTFDGVTVPPQDAGLPDTPVVGVDSGGDSNDAGLTDTNVPADACAAAAQGYLTLAEAAKACQYIVDCDTGQLELDIESNFGIVTSATNYAYCVNALAGTVPSDRVGLDIAQQTFKCIAHATACIQARGCLAVESLTANDARCAGNIPKNDAGVYCASGGNDAVDCKGGVVQHCKTPAFANGACVIDPGDPQYYGCGALTTPACATEVSSCDIATAVLDDCAAQTSVTTYSDCRVFGANCGPSGVDGGPVNACLTGGKYTPCDATTYKDQCVDDQIASCTYIGTLSVTSCKTLGKTCNAASGQPLCVGASDECSPYSLGIGECSGNSISLCVDGKRKSFDCACAGLVCGADAGIGKTHCVPPP